ncbi:MAG: flagellar hook-associated protein FlgK [Sulfurospirillum sp.]|nr:flagellar hook-associated protein FlgK [Sulfurospirillum sp.]MBL0703427.1 flagellar hook-associated protein FlgK [Sulfurospirillum sp.]
MSIFGTLNTGVSGLRASEIAIATTSHNIANANNEYYTRQRVVNQANKSFGAIPGDLGAGVKVTTIVRIHNELVFGRLRDSSNSLSYDQFKKSSLEEVARYLPDLEDAGLGQDIKNYFSSWNDLASNSDDPSQKIMLVNNSATLANNIKNTRENIRTLQSSINDQLKINVDEINSIGKQIADLNKGIDQVEAINPNRANDLRDQRDRLEMTLSDLLNVSVFKGNAESNNAIDSNLIDHSTDYSINVAGHSFVDGTTFQPLEINNTYNPSGFYSVYSKSKDGSTTDITDKLTGGKVGAMLELRGNKIDAASPNGYPSNGTLQGYIDDLDSFAKTFIEQTNSVYAKSAQESMSSLFNEGLKDNMPLSEYSESINTGTFNVIVYDKQGNEVARKPININSDTTMNDSSSGTSVVDQFNANTDDNSDNNSQNDVDDYFEATYSDGVLSFNTKDSLSGYTIAVEDNGTNFAGATGLSPFLKGNSASNIDVVSKYKDDPASMNANSSPVSGNNDVANDMVQMQYKEFSFHRSNGTVVTESVEGFYRFITTNISTDGESANRSHETSSALFNTVNAEFQSISGVSTDEELVDLMKFQASYGANAKVITTIDQMLDTLLGLKA